MTTELSARPAAAPAASRWLPRTRQGRAACWLGVAFVAWFVVNQFFVVSGQTVAYPRAPLIAFGLAGLAVGAVAGVVALVAVARHRERGLLVYLAMLPLVLVVAFLLGELLLPH